MAPSLFSIPQPCAVCWPAWRCWAGRSRCRPGRPRGRPWLPWAARPEKPGAAVIVRGTVLDDRNGQPVAGARVLIHNTAFGAVTDEKGRFELVMAANLAPLRSGKLALHIEGNPSNSCPRI